MQTEPKPQQPARLTKLCLAMSDAGVANTELKNVEKTFEEFIQRYSERPAVGSKDGSYFLRGPLKEGCSTRSNQNLDCAYLVVLDCDKSYDPETGQTSEGAPDPREVHEALNRRGVPHVIHTTHSNNQSGKGNRYRVFIPVIPCSPDLVPLYAARVCDWLAEDGVHVANVSENAVPGQPWYEPRLAKPDQEYLHYANGDEPCLDLTDELLALQQESEEIDGLDREVLSAPPRPPDSLPGKFNAKYGTTEQIVARLVEYGYQDAGTTVVNKSPARRLCCPGSTTGTPGVVVFQCTDGTVRTYSHHGSDPLNEEDGVHRAKDAFDVYRILVHGGDYTAAADAFRQELDPRPRIEHAVGEAHTHLRLICAELSRLKPEPIFQRGGCLVRVAHAAERESVDGVTITRGTASIIPYRTTTFSLLLSENFSFGKYEEKKWVPMEPFGTVVKATLDAFGSWGEIPVLRGISEAPILSDDGSLVAGRGYDRSTGLYIDGRTPPFDLPEVVSKENALAALDIVLSPFREFPFVDDRLGPATVLAYLLTLLQRPRVPTAPIFIFSATTPGTGKGLLVEVCNTIVRGRDAALMPPVHGKDAEAEMRKRLTSVIAYGLTSVNLDNCSRPLGGDAINALVTTTEWSDRQLGSNTIVQMPNCLTLAATGNNLGVRGDMVRRSILNQLDAQVERPEQRVFEERDLVGATRRRRSELLRALFMIIKGYQQSGCTDFQDDRLGRFEEWSERVCHPIQWLGLPNPTDSQSLLRQEDPEFEALSTLLTAWNGAHQCAWMGTKDLIPEHASGFRSDPLQEALERALIEAAGSRDRVDSKRLGWYLKRNLGRVAGGYRLERKDKGGLAGNHGHQYRVVPVDHAAATNPDQNDA